MATPMTSPMTSPHHITLDVQGLTLRRGMATIIAAMGFRLAAGRVLVVTGANGSGKTSLLRGLAGLMPLDGGEFWLNGRRAGEDPLTDKAEIIIIGHRDGLSGGLTAEENLRFWAGSRGMTVTDDQLTAAFDALGVGALRASETRHLSEGQRKRVGLVRLALSQITATTGATIPLWLMDEPLTAIDAEAAAMLTRLINAHTERGGAAIMTTHSDVALDRAERLDLNLLRRDASTADSLMPKAAAS